MDGSNNETSTRILRVSIKKSAFLSKFRLDNRALQRGDPKTGRAKIIAGTIKETGERIVLKHWRRDTPEADAALQEIWRQEIRQLHRLAGCPGAREFMVAQSDSGEDDEGFYLVLDAGQRLPIGALKQRLAEYHWLHQPKAPINRLRVWANLSRVAAGLDILHSQGLLHRNLDEWSVFSSGGDEPDFQLSGFEWSVRLAGVADRPASRIKAYSGDRTIFSFLEDWRDFGKLACSLAGIDWRSIANPKQREIGLSRAAHLSPLERELLSALLRTDPLARLDGDWVGQRINDILHSLRTLASGKVSTLHLTCNFNSGRLGPAIYEATNGEVDKDDTTALMDFVRRDLKDGPLLIAATVLSTGGTRLVLAGNRLTYSLLPYRPVQRGDTTWAIAYCETAISLPTQREIVSQQSLTFTEIEVIPLNMATRRLSILQGRGLFWDQQVPKPEKSPHENLTFRKFQGFLLLQQIEALVSAANIFPVRVVSFEESGEQVRISVQARTDPQRDRLSDALALRAPAARLAEIFADEQLSPDGTWKISEAGVLGNYDEETAKWRFVETVDEDGAYTIVFEGPGPVPNSDHLFLRKDDYVGNEALLRRRVRSLRTLKEHTELLEMLANPRKEIRKTHDLIDEDSDFNQLDKSKQDALREMWGVLPLFLVQGPPGVGKTRLVTELVRRTLEDEPSSRLLLTAQSHHAVDHLLAEVQKALAKTAQDAVAPLLVRTRPKDNDANDEELDVRQQAKLIIKRFAQSPLVLSAPGKLRSKVNALDKLYLSGSENTPQQAPQRGRDRSFEALLLRSANVVFASTNSGDLERLIEERAQFDWTIVEEAAKATGVEILAPLLLSHRRLMIGDHDQLPPYGEEQLRKLLTQPNKVRDALELARPMISSQLRDASLEDLTPEGDEFSALCGEAASVLNLFESFVRDELDGAQSKKHKIPIARRLTFQHRMHPAIAELVSESFYKGELKTDPQCAHAFQTDPPPFIIADRQRLPDTPIVFVDMPYGQVTPNSPNGERKPNYHNPDELEAVINVLSLLTVNSASKKKPSLAVLSPYRQQVRRLSARIKRELGTHLSGLDNFHIEGDGDLLAGTVDSFQGSEADVVVLSLVRNNHHSGKRALGFLSDPRRMNVLLSRAKWKLVVVCSTAFLRRRLPDKRLAQTDELYFLAKMFETVDRLVSERDVKGHPLATIHDVALLQPNGGHSK